MQKFEKFGDYLHLGKKMRKMKFRSKHNRQFLNDDVEADGLFAMPAKTVVLNPNQKHVILSKIEHKQSHM